MSNFSVSMMCTVYAFYFTFESSGLLESSKEIIPDSEFIKKMNRDSIDLNITSSIRRVGDCAHIMDFILLIFDKVMGIEGDGIVSLKSQTACLCDESVNINCSHATSLKKALEIVKEKCVSTSI